MTLWKVFEDVAGRFADRTAVEVQRREGLERFTYRQLQALALANAGWLAGHGIAPGDRCAIYADNDAHWCAAYLGILRLGAIAVPLDTNYSAAQVATILADCDARVLFVNERLKGTAADSGFSGIVREVHDTIPAANTVLPTPVARAAVILYTSGTTSDPKGVVLTHANLLAEREAVFKVVTVTQDDAVLGVLPLFHALAQLANLLLPFAAGARVVFLETPNSQELVRALADRRITIFVCVPQFFYLIHQRVMGEVGKRGWLMRRLFRAMMALGFGARRIGINLGRILFARIHATLGRQMRLLVTGGSKFDPAVGRDLYSMGLTIQQAYGLTETSGAATLTTPHDAHIDTVGKAVPGTEIRTLAPEAADVDGEIAIRGPIVMQGYFNRPDATAAVMRDGWLLTGDLGRIDAAGRLTITGRRKEVIVLANGKNIYPEEVEAHYRQSAYVKEICVVGARSADRPTSERLHAVIVPDADLLRERKMTNAGEILRFEVEGLSATLPPYKRVLGYDVWFDPLPRTTTGKLKRHEIERRLAEQADRARERGASTAADEAPEWLDDPHAAAAAGVIRGRLKTAAALRADANLELDLGLDSMERVELLTELEQRFGTKVADERAHEIFTVRHLIDAVRPGAGPPPLGDDSAEPRRGLAEAAAVRAAKAESREPATGTSESWAVLLRDLPPETDPMLSGLLERKPVLAPLLYAASRVAGFLLGRIRATGLEHLPAAGPFLICPNHQSYIDPFLVASTLPYAVFRRLFFVGAVEYFETPMMRRIARAANCVPVDPDSNLVPAMQAGAFGLSHGKVLMLFPEGERSIDGAVRKFKKGGPILARHQNVPIVPVALKGAHEIWPRGRSLNWKLRLPWSGHRVRVAFLPPMTFGEGEAYADAALRLRDAVNEKWETL